MYGRSKKYPGAQNGTQDGAPNGLPKEYVRKTKSAEQALASLMDMCAKAEKSSGDAMRLMFRWGVPEADRSGVLERLLRERFIDDERYAAAFVREKTRLSGWGHYKIAASLSAKGVARDVVEQALSQIDPTQMRERLIEKLQKKVRSLKATDDDYQKRAKLIRYGLSLGYDYDAVIQSIPKVFSGGEDF